MTSDDDHINFWNFWKHDASAGTTAADKKKDAQLDFEYF
jgi:hypothetical protein